MRLRRNLSVLALLVLLPAAGIAANYYVASDGSDGNSGTLAAPWRTLQKAADAVAAGDTTYVRGGIYGPVIIHASGSALRGFITFRNFPGEYPIIEGSASPLPGSDPALIRIVDQSYVVVTGFELRNLKTADAGLTPMGVLIGGSSQHVQIRSCDIHDIWNTGGDTLTPGNAHGIAVFGDSVTPVRDVSIEGNTLHDLRTGASESLAINGNVTGFQVIKNSIHDNNNIGVDFIGFEGVCPESAQDQARDGLCRGNAIFNITSERNQAYAAGDFSADGIYCDGATRVTIERNRVYGTDIGVELASEHEGRVTSAIILRDNLIYANHQAGLLLGGFAAQGTGGTVGCLVSQNTFFQNDTLLSGNGEAQLRFRTTGCDLRGNIFFGEPGNSLITSIGTLADNNSNTFDYNLYYSAAGSGGAGFSWNDVLLSGFAAWKSASAQDVHSLFPDQAFVNPAAQDFRLGPSSPAIDAGDPSFKPGPTETDFASESRIAGARVDIGANEFATAPAEIPSASLGNLSTRLSVGSGDNVLIGGFIVKGTHPKKVVLRACGPSLAARGLAGVLPDPSLTLVDSAGHIVAINNDWGDSAEAQEIAGLHLAPADPRESAILATLEPGAYTAILNSADGSAGLALMEAYDVDPATDSRLANISTRGLVQNGDQVLIGGIIVRGAGSEKVIVRARGPSLAGVAAPLSDPVLELRDVNGGLIASNDNWQDAAAAEISATNLAPSSPAESALLAALGPGNYTAIVRAKNGATGVGLVEVFELQ